MALPDAERGGGGGGIGLPEPEVGGRFEGSTATFLTTFFTTFLTTSSMPATICAPDSHSSRSMRRPGAFFLSEPRS